MPKNVQWKRRLFKLRMKHCGCLVPAFTPEVTAELDYSPTDV